MPSCPAELIEVPLGNGRVFRIELHYDLGSQHSIVAKDAHPIVLQTWISSEPITLSTLAGCSNELRQMCQLKLCDGSTMQAFPVPKAWTKYMSN